MADLREQKAITKELERQRDILTRHNETAKSYIQAQKAIKSLSADLVNLEEKLNKKRDRAGKEANTLNIEKQIQKLQKTGLGSLNKELSLESQIKLLKEGQSKNDKETVRQTKAYGDLLQDVATGSKDLEAVLNTIATEDFGIMNEAAEQLAETLRNTPDLTEKLKIEAQAQQKINDFRDKIKETSALLSSPLAMGVAVVGFLVKQMVDFAQKTLEVRQNLGTSVVESARLAGNMKAAGLAAKSVGGSSEEAEAAISAMVAEFGTTGSISSDLAISLGRVTGQFGISGANAAKLLKSMQGINGASAETNLSLISAVGELARAEGVAPGAVLNDIAENTETFAQFAKGGGENLAQAAIEARKLGLNLGTVASIAENLLDFESSIEKEMEASMLLGRQMNLDKARELALSGDLAGLAEEVKNQVGSQAEFEAMNVVQRKALAAAMGVTVSDLSKMVAGEKTSAQLAEDRVKTEKDLARLQLISAAALVVAAGARMGGFVGAIAGLAAAGAVYAIPGKVMGLEKGGVVKKSGMAEVHKGEVFSGTRNEMGMGNGQTNKLLRELIEQNEILMNKLTNRVGDIALSNAV